MEWQRERRLHRVTRSDRCQSGGCSFLTTRLHLFSHSATHSMIWHRTLCLLDLVDEAVLQLFVFSAACFATQQLLTDKWIIKGAQTGSGRRMTCRFPLLETDKGLYLALFTPNVSNTTACSAAVPSPSFSSSLFSQNTFFEDDRRSREHSKASAVIQRQIWHIYGHWPSCWIYWNWD